MRARSAVFDLYGDYLVSRAGWAPVAAVVALTGSCGIAAPATRTAIHRMVAQGWLEQQAIEGVRGYCATGAARTRLQRAHERIYATRPPSWDQQWHVLAPQLPQSRAIRDQVHAALGYLGYGRLGRDTWISPWRSPEVPQVLSTVDVAYTDVHGGSSRQAREVAAQVWDLEDIAHRYREFMDSVPDPQPLADLPPELAYRVRTDLVHRWRGFLFLDPGLPAEALSDQWPGHRARADFLAAAEALAPAASQFVDQTLREAGARDTTGSVPTHRPTQGAS